MDNDVTYSESSYTEGGKSLLGYKTSVKQLSYEIEQAPRDLTLNKKSNTQSVI